MLRVCKSHGKVIILVPYSKAVLYRIGKWIREKLKIWNVGQEMPLKTMKHLIPGNCVLVKEYVDDAQFKIALSNYKLSPKYSLDQESTEKAIEEFQKFLDDFPTSDLVPEANKYMKLCRDKLGKKYYSNAETYRKLTWYKSAIIYYDFVLDNYYDTKFAEKSLDAKAECFQKLGDFEQAIKFYKLYLEKYPDASDAKKVRTKLAKILDKTK